ncbi:MarR family winged helix-turn-helix transcriptional regulator [Actinokineospora soli]|uniref:MarR family winged helix-turn-helix transcriptional regulator n=1 Tax=Actinokineospora soli TaxID=1048753 RepID=A0ABW2TNR3_9PSEU
MSSIQEDGRARRRAVTGIKDSLRDLRAQLSLLNHRVSTRLGLRDVDLDCLELVQKQGPLTPSALARLAGLHPATLTGVLDRLQRAGWITRSRDPDGPDRRAVLVHAAKDRAADVYALYAGMNTAMDDLLAGYSDGELALLADFLERTTRAGRVATEDLTAD